MRKEMIRYLFILAVPVLITACGNDKKILSEAESNRLMHTGDSISTIMQNVLLKNVAAAIETGGTDHAIEYCNLQAIPLTDSVAKSINVFIQRLSDKNRNPNNAIKTTLDSMAWTRIKSEKQDFLEQTEEGAIYYYKPILLGMPTCIKCHGGKDDISESTQRLIAQKYPNDKAVGYAMGDLRGMWKIQLNEKK